MYLLNVASLLKTSNPLFELLAFRHAISTPLTVLLASFDEIESTPKSKNAFKQHKQALLTLKQLTLSFTTTASTKQNCDVSTMLQEIRMLLNSHNTICITQVGNEPLLLRKINAIRLKEALVCVIKNAIDASTMNNGHVVIVCSKRETYISVMIKDYGSGLAWLKKQLISFPLVSFKHRGSGVGLSFARRVIEKELGGRLPISTHQGFGTTVECLIPVVS